MGDKPRRCGAPLVLRLGAVLACLLMPESTAPASTSAYDSSKSLGPAASARRAGIGWISFASPGKVETIAEEAPEATT